MKAQAAWEVKEKDPAGKEAKEAKEKEAKEKEAKEEAKAKSNRWQASRE